MTEYFLPDTCSTFESKWLEKKREGNTVATVLFCHEVMGV